MIAWVWLVDYPYGCKRISCNETGQRIRCKFPLGLQTKLKEIGKEDLLSKPELDKIQFKTCARGIAKVTVAQRSNAFTIWDAEEAILAGYNSVHTDMASFKVDQFWSCESPIELGFRRSMDSKCRYGVAPIQLNVQLFFAGGDLSSVRICDGNSIIAFSQFCQRRQLQHEMVPCMLVAAPILSLVEHGKWKTLMVAPVSAVKAIKLENMLHQADDTADFQVANEDVQDEEDAIDVEFAKALLNHLRDWSGAIIDPQAAHHRGGASDVKRKQSLFKESGLQNQQFLYKFGASRKRHYVANQRRQRLEG